jgi:hypothetical protein
MFSKKDSRRSVNDNPREIPCKGGTLTNCGCLMLQGAGKYIESVARHSYDHLFAAYISCKGRYTYSLFIKE